MTALADPHEAEVARQFDRQAGRFKAAVAADDFRLRAVLDAIGPCRGLRVLDLGCGRGRFAARLREAGAEVVGLDRSAAMLAGAPKRSGLVLGSARRLPFGDGRFDAVVVVEVFEHLDPPALADALSEARRVLRPGGRLVVVDKNVGALDARRPWLPAVAVKWLDTRRGRWMYPAGGPARERWFRPFGFARRLGRAFEDVRVARPIAPAERGWWVFRVAPRFRLFAAWTAARPGGDA